ncbi:Transmembrane protein [Madurella fahalii]|uniref:Transmembrane protein n=1 Tax=Madurella fahalii TaxID=1157608 RepID=A0ABQ0GJA0_9PEZI
MTTAPTPGYVRQLASDHDFVLGAHPTPRRLGLWPFVATHLSLAAALGAGVIFVVVAIAYTSVTSTQMLECPSWANACHTADEWTIENLGTIQGIITLVYMIGLVALAYAALGFCETAVWPLLHKQPFTIGGLNAYLSATRGSIMSAPAALMSVRSLAAGFVLACALTVALVPFAAPPLVGHAYTPTWQPVQLHSNYSPGAGIGELYAQTNPPTSVIVRMVAEYDAWATDPASEPMPAYRDWYIDREALSERGNFTARAVRFQTSVSCSPHQLRQVNRDNVWWNAFLTNMTRTNNNSTRAGEKNSSAEVWVRPQQQLTIWADGFDFVSDRLTRTTLVIAALNGTIEGGSATPLILGSLTGASAIACDVEIEARDDVLSVGFDGHAPADNEGLDLPVLSSTSNLAVSPAASRQTRINELLLWFTVAPLMASPSVDGTQPMFTNSSSTNRPVALTTSVPPSAGSTDSNTWTIPGLEEFIHLSIGALAQATSTTTNPPSGDANQPGAEGGATLRCTVLSRKLSPGRAHLLAVLPAASLAVVALAAAGSARLHARLAIPVMRGAGLGELLKSAQTAWLREQAGTDAAKTYLPHELAALRVRYGVDADGLAGLGPAAPPSALAGFVSGNGNGKGKGRV